MGVSGSGKSTVGTALADRLGLPFEDGDHLHPRANVEKMAAGVPLTDDDRWPWLDLVGEWLAARPDGGVIVCSALKRVYRDRLRQHVPDADFLHLTGSMDTIAERQRNRPGHFMPPSLLPDQFATLEPLQADERGIAIDVSASVEEIVDAYLARR